MRVGFETALKDAKNDEAIKNAHFLVPYLPYWYAGMYVVVEGWKRLELHDQEVDGLLDAKHLGLLKRFRNGVYHFHPEYYDEKFRGFWAQGREAIDWANVLWSAFNKFFLRWLDEMKRKKGIVA